MKFKIPYLVEETNQKSGYNSTTTIVMDIETTEFSTSTDVYLNLSTLTDLMHIETTESSETIENNNTINFNISVEFKIELSFDDEFFGKMFDFFADTILHWDFDEKTNY